MNFSIGMFLTHLSSSVDLQQKASKLNIHEFLQYANCYQSKQTKDTEFRENLQQVKFSILHSSVTRYLTYVLDEEGIDVKPRILKTIVNRIKQNLIFSDENIKVNFNDDPPEDNSGSIKQNYEQGKVEDIKPEKVPRIKSGSARICNIKPRSIASDITSSSGFKSKLRKVGYSLVGLLVKHNKKSYPHINYKIFTLKRAEIWTDEENNQIGSYEDVKQKLK